MLISSQSTSDGLDSAPPLPRFEGSVSTRPTASEPELNVRRPLRPSLTDGSSPRRMTPRVSQSVDSSLADKSTQSSGSNQIERQGSKDSFN